MMHASTEGGTMTTKTENNINIWTWSSLPLATTGILIVRFDNDPRHNLTDRGTGAAITKLEASKVGNRDRI
jgi:hypothetical protein